jgi:hypothetical protein
LFLNQEFFMGLIENAAVFVGGLFFAAAFPQPSALIRAGAVKLYNAAKAKLFPAKPAE